MSKARKQPKHIALFSGTFDPIHSGHVAFIRAAMERGDFDELLVLIEEDPPRKVAVQSYEHRLNMAKQALTGEEHVFVDKLTMQKEGRNYRPKQTITELQEAYGQDVQITMIMGADLFEHMVEFLEHWPERDFLYEHVDFLIGLRTEDDGETAVMLKPKVATNVEMMVAPQPKFSSSTVREELNHQNNDVPIDQNVLQYIKEHKLYGYLGRKK